MRRALLVPGLLIMAACDTPPATMPSPDACGASELQHYVGQPQEALPDGIAASPKTRIILPGQAVTMDYNPERLNIAIGEDGLIVRISCG